MIKHIVCFKLKNNDSVTIEETKKILLSMRGNVSNLLDINVGVDYLHSSRSYDIILETYFASKEEVEKYQVDEYHCQVVKKHMHSVSESSIAIDYVLPEKFEFKIKDHALNYDLWESKEALFKSFFQSFYHFILEHNGENDLKTHNINNVEDFYAFADWNAGGKDSCYAMGFGFHKYFLKPIDSASLSTQDDSTFIGYCVKNDLYVDFIKFLITFFAWWRNDEGCTCFDPYNHCDEFFHSSWAALVDTCKLFYLTSETVYGWQSFRVKYALDHIPGIIRHYPRDINDKLVVSGYEFKGFKNDGEIIAEIVRKDQYNYWEKEEKTIKKNYVKDYKIVDPA